jgi:predicted ATPase
VAAVLDCDAAEVEERLDALDRVHALVRFTEENEFPDRTLTLRYRFVHALYQDALDASLRPTRRASLSAAVAKTLLARYGENYAEASAELALLWEAARDFDQAVDCFLLAAQNAIRLFANQEGVKLARRGLSLLASLPDTLDRSRKELALQITLGPALFATQNWSAPEVESAYTRADALCHKLGDSPDLFRARWGLFLYQVARGDIQQALQLGEQLQDLAQESQDPALLLQAHHATGPILGLVGDWTSSRRQLEEAVAYYDRKAHADHASLYGGHDPCVCCQGYGAKALWMLGYPDQAMQLGNKALALARELGHPTSLAHTQFSVAILHQFRREAAETLQLAETLQKLAADQGLLYYLAGAMALRGWALAELGKHDEGLAQLQQAFDVGGATRAHWRSFSLALYAEASGKAGRHAEGLTMLTEARTIVEASGIRLYEPEIHRLTGELMLALDPTAAPLAESRFLDAVAVARRYQAKSLALRAMVSLSRLGQRTGRADETVIQLTALYDGFSEGLLTPDLLNAATLLNRTT